VSNSGAQLERHVRKFEGHALELADLLSELHAIDRPLLGALERPVGAPETVGRHLQARCSEPGVGHFESPVQFPGTADFGTRQS